MRRLKSYLVLVVFFIAIISVSGCTSSEDPSSTIPATFLSASQAPLIDIKLEIAATPGQRSMGLMYRSELKPHHGMLFIFPRSEPQSFWMKNTQIPLDMFFLDESFTVVALQQKAEPYTTVPRDSKGQSAKYVVELIGGTAEKVGIKEGCSLKIDALLPEGQ